MFSLELLESFFKRCSNVVFILRITIEFLSFHFQSPCELYFESIQIFIKICTRSDCVTDPFTFRDLLLIPSCLIGTIDVWTWNVLPLEEITLWKQEAIPLTVFFPCLLREVGYCITTQTWIAKLNSWKFSMKYSSLFFEQIFSSSEDGDSALEKCREMWFESQICGG